MKEKKIAKQILTYPLVIRTHSQRIVKTLGWLKEIANKELRYFYHAQVLDALAANDKKAYKILEPLLPQRWRGKIPSRVHRGILEVVGRVLRSLQEKRNLFTLLTSVLGENPGRWDYRKLIRKEGIYVKSQYVKNLGEQTENFFQQEGSYPGNFFSLQRRPKLVKPMTSFAPDDGQAIVMEKKDEFLVLHLKVLAEEGNSPWEWIETKIPLPSFLRPYSFTAPDLRLAYLHGEWLPILDYKISLPLAPKQQSPAFLTVDWGIRKLLTLCVFDREGHQLCPPIFLKFQPLQDKLLRLRSEIANLQSLRDQLPPRSSLWRKYNREIAKRWRKFRALQHQLAHLASNVIVLVAQIYQCGEIYVEWLKTLKSQDFSADLNWVINTTVREAIYEKVAYKAKLLGISLKRPVQPWGTSQFCPRCGKKGHHTKAPNSSEPVKSGSWFVCPSCGYNADRDYVACLNLARKVLYGNLSGLSKVIAYKAKSTPDPLFRQGSSLPRERLRRNLHGWKEVITLTPQKFFCGTLRL